VLHLLVDTSTWLDLAKRRDGQRLIVLIRVLMHQVRLDILVPQVVIDEFERNRPRVEASMTSEVAQRFKLIRRDLVQYGSEQQSAALEMLDQLAHQVPLIGAMTTRNFEEIREQLDRGTRIEPTADDRARVVARGLAKAAPFHRNRNGMADALLIELYSTSIASARDDDRYAFVTTNSDDFSAVGGDNRQPHADLVPLFAREQSSYRLGVEGLEQALAQEFGDEWAEISENSYFEEEPRRLDEILAAEQELFDRIWYDRSMLHEQKAIEAGDDADLGHLRKVAGPGRARVEQTYGIENLGPYDKFEWGMLNGKLSALRWVLGEDWDFLDT
jgi:PIN domain